MEAQWSMMDIDGGLIATLEEKFLNHWLIIATIIGIIIYFETNLFVLLAISATILQAGCPSSRTCTCNAKVARGPFGLIVESRLGRLVRFFSVVWLHTAAANINACALHVITVRLITHNMKVA